jgi:hypothetical protein
MKKRLQKQSLLFEKTLMIKYLVNANANIKFSHSTVSAAGILLVTALLGTSKPSYAQYEP